MTAKSERDRKKRLRDFRERKDFNRENVYVVANKGWEYIPVHPFADETEILRKLDFPAERCVEVDAYWNWGEDVVFIQVAATSDDGLPPSLYARYSDRSSSRVNLYAVLTTKVVIRADFERTMHEFADKLYLRTLGPSNLDDNFRKI